MNKSGVRQNKKSRLRGPGFKLPREGATKPDPVSKVSALHETISYHGECEPQNKKPQNIEVKKIVLFL